jgi:hypothetical protein
VRKGAGFFEEAPGFDGIGAEAVRVFITFLEVRFT